VNKRNKRKKLILLHKFRTLLLRYDKRLSRNFLNEISRRSRGRRKRRFLNTKSNSGIDGSVTKLTKSRLANRQRLPRLQKSTNSCKNEKKKNNDAMMSRIEKITKTVSDKMLVKTSFVDQFLFIKNAKLSVSFNRLIIHAIAMTSFTPESRRDIVTCD